MINAKIENGQFSVSIKLIGAKEVIAEFYFDTGFNGYLKIDKKLFDELDLKIIRKENVNLANGNDEIADISRIKFQVDEAVGESEVMAVGWGGRNLIGTKFLGDTKMILIIDGVEGIYLTSNRMIAYEVGKAIFTCQNILANKNKKE